MRLGLRFRRGDARILARVKDTAIERGQGDVGLYEKALACASSGEPLIVVCEEASEVHQMAALFGYLGIKPPTVEELNDPGAAGA